MNPRDLPVWQLHADVLRHLQSGNQLVVVAATGSGKTTQVPQMIRDAGLVGDRIILILQPRRVAARSVAARVAWERQGRLGDEVGYQVRFDDRTSRGTRLCFVTEGVLLRWLQDDRELSEVGAVVFDEFHERNLLSDVSLALVKDLQRTRRPDLKIVVMSATLEAEPVARYLGAAPDGTVGVPAPVVVSEGRTFPVEVRWAEYGDDRPAPEKAAEAVERIVSSAWEGDILVFMPGMAEINATVNEIRGARLGERVVLLPLHGDLPAEDQDRAFQPAESRKIIVSTNVAETSVTIDGIRHVVDAGLARVARYDAERGLQTLAIETISRASADQRAGRAGRTAPGTCWRLWTESGHLNRAARNTPEIQRADLAEVVLLLHSLGVRSAAEFDWLDRPDRAAVQRAERLLGSLGALSAAGELTPVGRQMLRLPMHPRFGRMLVEASVRGCVPAAALCAALVSGRDLMMRVGRDDVRMQEAREVFEASRTSDFHTLMRAFQHARNTGFSVEACRRAGLHAQTARQVEETRRQFLQLAVREGLLAEEGGRAGEGPEPAPDALERCLLAGFADQLAMRRDRGTLDCELTEGRRATLARDSVVQEASLFVAASVREITGRGGTVTLLTQCTAVSPEWLAEMFPQHLSAGLEHLYDRGQKRVAAVKVRRFLDLVLDHEHQRDLDPTAAGECLADAASRGWIDLPNLDHGVKQFLGRVGCVRAALPGLEFPVVDGAFIRTALAQAFRGLWLAREAQQAALLPAFRSRLAPEQLAWLDELAPTSFTWLDGKTLKLAYVPNPDEPESPPVPEAQVKLTECFALKEHPRIVEGRVPVRLWLMLPDGRRLGSTTDWPGWRAGEYVRIRSQLRSKHPGFVWP